MSAHPPFRPGEAEILVNGEPKRLRLTLGALAELEETLGGGDFGALRARLASPNARDLLLILNALIAGGGAPIAFEVLKRADIDFAAAARAIAETFRGLAGEDGPGKPEGERPASPGRNGSPAE